MNLPKVSIIIPCYNGEKWIGEAVDSCLSQTYPNVEIIVVNDGSIDNSLEILHKYGARIIVDSGPNRGLSAAENRGFQLTSGEYIQYLDADDFLLPEKIQHQMEFMSSTGAEVVYGDWRHQFHLPNGEVKEGEVIVSGIQQDVLESALGGWWVPNMALLYKREVVEKSGGWDESLTAQNDHDFLLSVTLLGVDIRYQSGCYSVYRRYGNVTLGTSDKKRFFVQDGIALEKAEAKLIAEKRLSRNFANAIASSYFRVARGLYDYDTAKYHYYINKMKHIAPNFTPQGTRTYRALQSLMGYTAADQVASLKRRFTRHLSFSSSYR